MNAPRTRGAQGGVAPQGTVTLRTAQAYLHVDREQVATIL